MIALQTGFAALTVADTSELFGFAVHFFDLPAQGTHRMSVLQGANRSLVGHEVFRAVWRHHNPEQLHFVVFGKTTNLNSLARLVFPSSPFQTRYRLVLARARAVINLTVGAHGA